MKYQKTMAAVLGSLLAAPAFAYLDPGSGSMLLQLILGGLAGIAVAGKLFWQQIVGFFSFGRGNRAEPEEEEPTETP